MNAFTVSAWGAACCLVAAGPAMAATVTLEYSGKAPYDLGSKVWFLPKLDGVGKTMALSVNGIRGVNATVGKINEQNGEFNAPTVMPEGKTVLVTATTLTEPQRSASVTLSFKAAAPAITGITPTLLGCAKPFTLTVTGLRFGTDAVVWINSRAAPTTFVSGTELAASGLITQPNSSVAVKVVSASIGSSVEDYRVKVGACSAEPTPSPTPEPAPAPLPVVDVPAPDAATVAAARFLEQASFGPSPATIAALRQAGTSAWLAQQLAMAPTPLPVTADLNTLRNNWYMNMATGQDQLRQRMVFALSQIFVVSADKNPYAAEIQPWLATLHTHAFGNFKNLLREMSLNPAMGKYLDLGNSILPSPNENYAREVMQLFTVGPNLLNQDGSLQLDRSGDPIPTYDQARIGDISRALSGWTYAGTNPTGINWENFSGPLQPRDKYHDKGAKTLLGGISIPAGQGTVQDFDAVMDNLFQHPNLPPFIATRLIRHFVSSNPSPAYITRVAGVFANSANGRGDLAATLQAVLLDPEARADAPTANSGHLKDPMLHTIGLMRAMNASLVNPAKLFWDYFLIGEKIVNAPSVFNFYSPMTRLPGSPQAFGPEFQIYAPSLAVARANLIYRLVTGEYSGIVKFDLSPYVAAAADPATLIKLVDANLTAGRMTPSARSAIAGALAASSDNRQRAITALYLTAVSAEFAVSK
ncbi:MAG: DUF1800 domain-containing protein [Pseudomonadota bacterium]